MDLDSSIKEKLRISQHSHSHGQCCDHDHGHGHGHGHAHEQIQIEPYVSLNKFLDKSKYKIDFVNDQIEIDGVKYLKYKDETQMPLIMNLITKDLSEPYSIYTYRYFIHNWPFLCFLVILFYLILNKIF